VGRAKRMRKSVQYDRKCICMYAPTASGGHPRYVWELLTALARQGSGHRFELVTSRDIESCFSSDLYIINPILPPLAHRSEFRWRAAWVASRLLYYPCREMGFVTWLRSRPDIGVVHLQEWFPALAAPELRAIRRMGKKVFFTVHNIVPHMYPAMVPKRLFNHAIRRACRACDGLFVHTRGLAEELAAFLQHVHPPITVTPHGVWTVGYGAGAAIPRQDWERKRLLFFGVIRPNKGLDILLRAMESLDGYSLTIAGEASELGYFQKEIMPRIVNLRRRGINVELMERFIPENQVGDLFSSHSAIVLPYTKKFVAQSGVVFMALAYNLPVVASEAGGLADLFAEHHFAATFSDDTPEAIVRAIRELHETPAGAVLIERMGAARQTLSWQATAAATLAAYAANGQEGNRN